MRIQYNGAAMNAVRNYGIISNRQAGLAEKLASGYAINRAADNAAGLKISEKMRGQIRGLQQASRNAQDGISFLQTADGALNEVHSILQRVRELAVQAANDTNVSADRQSIQEEVDQLLEEVNRITEQSEFNTRKIFDGSLQGSSSGGVSPYLKIDGTNIRIFHMVNEFVAAQTPSGSSQIGDYTALADVLDREIVPQAVKALLHTYPGAFGYLNDCSIGIGLAIENNANSSALASVTFGTANGRYEDGKVTYDLKYKLTVNVAYLSLNDDGTLTGSSRQDLEGTIIHEMTHALMDETLTKGMFSGSNGYPLWFIEGMAQTAVGGYADFNDWVNGGLGIRQNTSVSQISNIVKASANKLGASSGAASYGTGYLACMYLGQLASGKGLSSEAITPQNISTGLDKILKKLGEGNSLNDVIKDVTGGKYAGISDFESKFGDTDSAAFIRDLTAKVGSGNGSLAGGDFTKTDLLPDSEASVSVFDLNPDAPFVINRYPAEVEVVSGGGKDTAGTAPIPDYGTGGTVPSSGGGNINITSIRTGSGNGYTFDGSTLRITGNGDYNLTGTKSGISIVIEDGVEVNINVKDLNVTSATSSGITIGAGAKVTMNVAGKNQVISQTGAGICVNPTGSLKITGEGIITVNAKSGSGAAAIGGNNGEAAGTISIAGTEGKALVIDANGDTGASAIGAGKGASGGTVNKTNGIILDGKDGSGSVYGKVTLTDKIDTKGGRLTVESGAILTVSSTGNIVDGSADAKITNKGTIENHGKIGSSVTNSGGGVLKNYISKITAKKPVEVTAGSKLVSSNTSTASITYNGGKTATLSGIWSVKDSSGNIVDLANAEAEESQNYTYSITYKLSDAQVAEGLIFSADSSLVSNMIQQDNLSLKAYGISNEVVNHAVTVNAPTVSADGRSITITYNMKPKKAPAAGGGGSTVSADGLMLQIGANEGQAMSITIDKLDTKELGLDGLSVRNHDDANDAIALCDTAISKVSSVRSRIGAYQNRLEHAVDNLENTAENLQTAESRIRDLDMANAMVEYAKNQIIMQAAQAMIAQANQVPEGMLQLIR